MPRVLLEELPARAELLDPRLLAFAFAATMVTAALSGLAPGLSPARSEIGPLLKAGGHTASRGENRRLLSGFVIVQVAISTLLLAGAFSMLRGLHEARTRSLGLDTRNLWHAELDLPLVRYASGGDRNRALTELLRRVGEVPGVARVAATTVNPLWGGTWGIGIAPEAVSGDPLEYRSVNLRLVTPGLLATLGTALLVGRDVGETDREDSPPVAIVSRRMAGRLGGDREALGRTIVRRNPRGEPVRMQVVGVAGDVADYGHLAETVYLPYRQLSDTEDAETVHLMVRGGRTRRGLNADIARAVRSVDPGLALADVSPMESFHAESLSQQRLGTLLLAGFGAFALALAAIGTYGLMAFRAGRRRAEIGVRMAFGASRIGIEGLFIREGLNLALPGGVLGIAAAWLLRPALARSLGAAFVSSPHLDAAVVGILVIVSAVASWAPARRAATADPMRALRGE
jgi:putative ABC transport system permease protein